MTAEVKNLPIVCAAFRNKGWSVEVEGFIKRNSYELDAKRSRINRCAFLLTSDMTFNPTG